MMWEHTTCMMMIALMISFYDAGGMALMDDGNPWERVFILLPSEKKDQYKNVKSNNFLLLQF